MSKNLTRECEMLEMKGAYRVFPSQEIRRQFLETSAYVLPATEKGVVLCEIPEGQCPYGGEGRRTTYGSANSLEGDVCICNLDGLVEEASLLDIKKKPKREIDGDKSRAF